MILILGGTSDSLAICDMINELENQSYVLSVTTEYGKELAQKHTNNIVLGKLGKEEMLRFIKDNHIARIIDATHPYAVEVSKNAITCAKLSNIEYIRFERKSLIEEINYDNKFIVDTIEEACKIANKIGKNIFIGTGSKNLNRFVEGISNKNLVVRVLPASEVILSCEKLGLNADNIVAMKGPFSQCINEETYKHYDVDLVITKESGVAGGFLEKVNACKNLNIPVVIIKRESINYENVINDINKIKDIIV
ncbi:MULTISPECIES: precorrin-6A reductase [unclassified Clostridioides]|uniref:precorrin-6A reductase n=1 Tax=unclassified Clostridioides TaxID=2635829 RepID=UPI001D12052D|nr:precorrin-6A reductase [Clostridioides sp. ES-S-0001-02]MCC0705697.1 precorrin-6A reductase [Clostridioides sp. ES-S-0190-01]